MTRTGSPLEMGDYACRSRRSFCWSNGPASEGAADVPLEFNRVELRGKAPSFDLLARNLLPP